MRALVLTSPGHIEMKDVAMPSLSPGKALVKIKAVALNRRDDWIREGKYPHIKTGCIMGSDGAGMVDSVAEDENKDWVGKEVVINPNIDWGANPDVQSGKYTILGMPVDGKVARYSG